MLIITFGDTLKRVFKVSEDIHAMFIACLHQRKENTWCVSPFGGAIEQPIFSSDYKEFNGTLRAVIVYFKSAIINVLGKAIPMLDWVEKGFSERRFWQSRFLLR